MHVTEHVQKCIRLVETININYKIFIFQTLYPVHAHFYFYFAILAVVYQIRLFWIIFHWYFLKLYTCIGTSKSIQQLVRKSAQISPYP